MKPKMKVTVWGYPAQNGRDQGYGGIVEMPNLAPTKLRKENGSIVYSTVSNLRQAAVAAAKKYNADLQFVELKRVAAKKSK